MHRRSLIACGLVALLSLLAGCAWNPGEAPQRPAQTRGVYKIGQPYQINGVWYYPAEDLTYDETGIASWYGEDFHGKFTANGEIFDLNALSAAHRTLPMPSIVQVTNLDNGRTLKLRVNDRGPYARGRIIDVSRRAAQLLGFESPGIAKVRVQILAPESIQAKLLAQRASGQQAVAAATAVPLAPVAVETLQAPPGVQVASQAPPPPRSAAATPPPINAPIVAPAPLPEQVTNVRVRPTNIYVQAGAFSNGENASRLKARLASFGNVRVTDATVNGVNLYRVRIGPLGSVDEADRMLDRIVGAGMPEARIVVD